MNDNFIYDNESNSIIQMWTNYLSKSKVIQVLYVMYDMNGKVKDLKIENIKK